MTNLFPNTQIDIFMQVLQADGGTRCACINAASLALIDAGIPMKDFVVSCAAGYIENTPILDLNYFEDAAGGPDVPIAFLPKMNKISLLQMDSKLSIENFEKVLSLAEEGCLQIHKILDEEVKKKMQKLAEKKGLYVKNQ
jgi:exosome complex component RRP41